MFGKKIIDIKKLPNTSSQGGTIEYKQYIPLVNLNTPSKVSTQIDLSNQTEYTSPTELPNQTKQILTNPQPALKTDNNNSKILYPLLPYHVRWQNYIERRNQIFNVDTVTDVIYSKPKRSTLRLRKYWKLRKLSRRFLVSAIISDPKDKRYYAKVSFLNFNEFGLLDTGANISCIGADLATSDFEKLANFTKIKSFVKTADGSLQKVLGWLDVHITFKNQK